MFKKALRKKVKLKLAITGPSGSGKTYSALLIARGLVGKSGRIALVDTENGSASLYADKPEIGGFDVLDIKPPYTVEAYRSAIQAAVNEKYDCLVVDSLTHQWAGDGGLLATKEKLDARGGNSYTNWAKLTPEHEKFKGDILHSDIHLIGTMRSKQDYVLETNDKGKQAPKKVGLAPVQREGIEYEFTVVFDLAMNHMAEVSKDRTGLFDGKLFTPSLETGKQLITWLESGVEAPAETKVEAKPDQASVSKIAQFEAWAATKGWPAESVYNFIWHAYDQDKLNALTDEQKKDLKNTIATTEYLDAIFKYETKKGDEKL